MSAINPLSKANPVPLWFDSPEVTIPKRTCLQGDKSVDIAIVGGGFSGLWTAYYLLRNDPSLRVLVIEKEYCGFGASGRNGGWCKGSVAGGAKRYAKQSSIGEARRLERSMFDTVDEIQRVLAIEGIQCGFQKGGVIRLARNTPQSKRQAAEINEARSSGFGDDIIRFLEPEESKKYLNATDIHSGIFFSPAAVVDPARLVVGLASAVELLGGEIVEETTVSTVGNNRVVTTHGVVTTEVVVQATEAFTRDFNGKKLDLLPFYSRMIATEPLGQDFFDQLGLAERPAFSDDRYSVIYGIRTEDDRIAFGGRGTPPYLFGSKISSDAELNTQSHELVYQALIGLLPQLHDVEITHRWGGVLGIPRNWLPGLRFNKSSGLGVLGGYVGAGVAAANLAGRTMADLILDRQTDRVTLPWVGVHSRPWEPEPFRWIGVRTSGHLLAAADDSETRTGKTARLAMKIAHLLRGD